MDIDTTANYKLGGAQQHDSVRLDPWVFMFSAGYRFLIPHKNDPVIYGVNKDMV